MLLEVVHWSTSVATIAVAVFGYSDQIKLIFEHKSTGGLSFVMILLAFFSWASYTLYGWLHKDKKLFWSNLLGTVFISIILASFFIF
ncbi:MAG: SemiSWEET family transporter [bacterium]|nr:SemiSWEET family transporter [bacterium]